MAEVSNSKIFEQKPCPSLKGYFRGASTGSCLSPRPRVETTPHGGLICLPLWKVRPLENPLSDLAFQQKLLGQTIAANVRQPRLMNKGWVYNLCRIIRLNCDLYVKIILSTHGSCCNLLLVSQPFVCRSAEFPKKTIRNYMWSRVFRKPISIYTLTVKATAGKTGIVLSTPLLIKILNMTNNFY